jgi:hypothetical protein
MSAFPTGLWCRGLGGSLSPSSCAVYLLIFHCCLDILTVRKRRAEKQYVEKLVSMETASPPTPN